MNTSNNIVLALYPNARGFGYAFLESAILARDCGIVTISPISNSKCLKRIKEFIEYYEPTLVIVQDCKGKYSRKSQRVKDLIETIVGYCHAKSLPVKRYTREQIRFVFAQFNCKSKFEIARKIAEALPMLQNKLPEMRKPWMCENYNQGIYDSISLAFCHFYMTD